MALSGEQYQRLEAALLAAFSQSSLARMVRFHLNENLDEIVGNGPFTKVVFELISWAEAEGRTAELVEAAHQFNPGNPMLTTVWQELTGGVSAAPVGQAAGNQTGYVPKNEAPKRGIKILFLASNPGDLGHLHLDKEHREITARIRASEYRDQIELISEWAIRPIDIMQALLQHKPEIVHFSSHGTQQEELLLVDDRGEVVPVSKQALTALFSVLRDNIKVVVFNACFSEGQAEAIIQYIPCAVGTNKEIGVDDAIRFSEAFYLAIGFGRSVQEAFALGTIALPLSNLPDGAVPQLKVKTGEDASKITLVGR